MWLYQSWMRYGPVWRLGPHELQQLMLIKRVRWKERAEKRALDLTVMNDNKY